MRRFQNGLFFKFGKVVLVIFEFQCKKGVFQTKLLDSSKLAYLFFCFCFQFSGDKRSTLQKYIEILMINFNKFLDHKINYIQVGSGAECGAIWAQKTYQAISTQKPHPNFYKTGFHFIQNYKLNPIIFLKQLDLGVWDLEIIRPKNIYILFGFTCSKKLRQVGRIF